MLRPPAHSRAIPERTDGDLSLAKVVSFLKSRRRVAQDSETKKGITIHEQTDVLYGGEMKKEGSPNFIEPRTHLPSSTSEKERVTLRISPPPSSRSRAAVLQKFHLARRKRDNRRRKELREEGNRRHLHHVFCFFQTDKLQFHLNSSCIQFAFH